jgi:predicted ABC-type transport system involved in lysophospholipase L1 biosynthesis ATPase subunit
MAAAGISVRGLEHVFSTPSGPLTVLDGLDLEVAAGEHVVVVGPSGSGKSTLLSLLGGLEPPQSGEIVVGGHDLRALRGDGLAAFRRTTVGFVFQHFGLLDALTAEENIELAGTLAGRGVRERRSRARELLEAVGLAERRHHRPPQLSGGERQRVALARALANRPRLVLADEPTGNLDAASGVLVGDLLADLPAGHACTVVVVTHDERLAEPADRRLGFVAGALVPVERVSTIPVDEP